MRILTPTIGTIFLDGLGLLLLIKIINKEKEKCCSI